LVTLLIKFLLSAYYLLIINTIPVGFTMASWFIWFHIRFKKVVYEQQPFHHRIWWQKGCC